MQRINYKEIEQRYVKNKTNGDIPAEYNKSVIDILTSCFPDMKDRIEKTDAIIRKEKWPSENAITNDKGEPRIIITDKFGVIRIAYVISKYEIDGKTFLVRKKSILNKTVNFSNKEGRYEPSE